MPIALVNAAVVLEDRVLSRAAVVIDGSFIRAVDPERLPPGCEEVDCAGDLLIPGVVDVHADHIEKIMEPRVGSVLPIPVAIDQSDRVNAGAGITTAYHALTFADGESKVRTVAMAEHLSRELAARRGRTLIDHRIHCRYEVTDLAGAPVIARMIDEGVADMVSLMDHSPGQGQFHSMEQFINYYCDNIGTDRATAEAMARRRLDSRNQAWHEAEILVTRAREANIVVASHDDDDPEIIARHHSWGVGIAEFPVNQAASAAATNCGMTTVLGAPNILRGGSQSGNMRALDAFLDGSCACLCSDYVPWIMLPAAFHLETVAGWTRPQAVASVTSNPALAAGLDDRGRITPGLRADLVRVAMDEHGPRVVATWCAGRPALATVSGGSNAGEPASLPDVVVEEH